MVHLGSSSYGKMLTLGAVFVVLDVSSAVLAISLTSVPNNHEFSLEVTTNKSAYIQDEKMVVTVKDKSNKTIIFSNTAYGLYFERWNGSSWEFYTGLIGLEVITHLDPGETAKVEYYLGSLIDRPFPEGRYRVVSEGFYENKEKIIRIQNYAEFKVWP